MLNLLLSFKPKGVAATVGLSESLESIVDNYALELCPKNNDGLLPVHLAIARGHYFLVHQLLCYEQVILQLTMVPYDLYLCFKFAISN